MRAFLRVFDRILIAALVIIPLIAFAAPIGLIDNIRYPMLAVVLLAGLYSILNKSLWRARDVEAFLSSKFFPWVLAILMAAVFVRIKCLQFEAGQISGVDFSHLDYAIWSTAKGRFMQIPIVPDVSSFTDFFGNHYSPILFVHVFFRYIFDSPLTALWVHAFSLAAAIPVLYSLARTYLEALPSAVLTLVFVFCGAVASTLQFDIHQESFFPLAFGLFFLGYRTRLWKMIFGAVLVLSIKEDAGIYLFWTALVLAVFAKERRMILAGISLFSILYTVIALKVLMPMHQPQTALVPYYFTMWAKYGSSFQEVIFNMIRNPHWVISDVVFNKALYKNLLPWAFLPLLHPFGILWLPPVVISSTALGVQSGFGLYYGIVLVPLFFFVSCAALQGSRHKSKWLGMALCCSFFVGGSYLRFPGPLAFLPEIEAVSKNLSTEKPKEIWVQSGLLPFLEYGTNWRRLDSVDQLEKRNTAEVILFDGLEQSSLIGDANQLDQVLREKGFLLVESSGRFRRYRK